jgi:negative regulator of sigma E activity
MSRIPRSLSLARGVLVLAIVAIATVPVSAQDSVEGKWVFTMAGPQGQMDVEFVFKQDGAAVTGTVDLPAMPEIEGTEVSDGLYEDGLLSFLLHVSAQGQWFTVEIEAEVDGDEMVGEAFMAEMGQTTPFTGKRAEG